MARGRVYILFNVPGQTVIYECNQGPLPWNLLPRAVLVIAPSPICELATKFNSEVCMMKSIRLFALLSVAFLPAFTVYGATADIYATAITGQCPAIPNQANAGPANQSAPSSFGTVKGKAPSQIAESFSWTNTKDSFKDVSISAMLSTSTNIFMAYLTATNGGVITGNGYTGATMTGQYALLGRQTATLAYKSVPLWTGLTLSPGTYTVVLFSPSEVIKWETTTGQTLPAQGNGLSYAGYTNLVAGTGTPNPVATPPSKSIFTASTNPGALCFAVKGTKK